MPNLITYHGRIQADGVDLNGSAQVKFALISTTESSGTPAIAEAPLQNGVIVGIGIVDRGSGYVSAPEISVTDRTGSGAVLSAVLSGGRVNEILVINGGTGYSAPTITVAPLRPRWVR